jgi:hypothetical protein
VNHSNKIQAIKFISFFREKCTDLCYHFVDIDCRNEAIDMQCTNNAEDSDIPSNLGMNIGCFAKKSYLYMSCYYKHSSIFCIAIVT